MRTTQNNPHYLLFHTEKWYFARVEYKKTMSIDDMAKHMAEHNTPFSDQQEGYVKSPGGD